MIYFTYILNKLPKLMKKQNKTKNKKQLPTYKSLSIFCRALQTFCKMKNTCLLSLNTNAFYALCIYGYI